VGHPKITLQFESHNLGLLVVGTALRERGLAKPTKIPDSILQMIFGRE